MRANPKVLVRGSEGRYPERVGLLAFGFLMLVAGFLVGRYGYGKPTHEGYNGVGPRAWKAIGGAIAAIGIAVVLVGTLA